MPRVAGIVIAGQPQHVVERGNNRQDVFRVEDDRVGMKFPSDGASVQLVMRGNEG